MGALLAFFSLLGLLRAGLLLLQGEPGTALVGAVAGVLLAVAALLTRRGFECQRRQRARRLSHHPVPFRTWALFLTVLAALLIALGLDHDGFWHALTLGGLAGLGYWLDYGLDPGCRSGP